MLKRYFISNILIMVLLNVLVKPFWIFGIDRNVQEAVGYEDYGLYAALLNLSIIFNILLDLGITNYNNKTIAEQPNRIGTLLPNMLIAKGVLSLLYFGVILLLAVALDYSGVALGLLVCIAGIQLMNSMLLFLRSNISANHDFKLDGLFSVLDKLLMIAFCGYLLFNKTYEGQFKIEWFVYAQLVAYGLTACIALVIILIKYTRLNFKEIAWPQVKELLIKSMPYAMLILLMGVYMRSDGVLLERLLPGKEGAFQNGVYVSAFRMLDALNMFGFLFAGILLPMFSRMIARRNNVAGLIKTSANLLLPVALAIVGHSYFYNTDIMNMLYENNTAEASTIYRFVIMCFPAYCITYVYSTLLTANGDIKLLIKIALVASVISVGANLVFIPLYKSTAVSITALVVQWLLASAFILFSIRRTDIAFKWSWAAQFLLFFLTFFAINYGIKELNINLLTSIVINALCFFPAIYFFKLWNWKEMIKYFQDIVVKD